MLDEKWVRQRVGVVFSYWEARVPSTGLFQKCVERTMEMIRQYRDGEDPEQYRAMIERMVLRHIEEA